MSEIATRLDPQEAIAPQVMRALRDAIVRIELTPGTVISEADIARRFGVSRQPVREAFIKLQEAGLVAVRPQRGTEVLHEIQRAMQAHQDLLERALSGIAAYVTALVERPHYLRMHLREGLSWTQRTFLRTGQEVATWERGIELALGLLERGIAAGFFYADDRPDVLLKMMIASHQVGRFGRNVPSGVGASATCFCAIAIAVSALNGSSRVSSR